MATIQTKTTRAHTSTGNDTPLGISLVHPSISNAIWWKDFIFTFQIGFGGGVFLRRYINLKYTHKRQIYHPTALIASNVCTLYNLHRWMCNLSFKNHKMFASFKDGVVYASHLSSLCFALFYSASLVLVAFNTKDEPNIDWWPLNEWREEKRLLSRSRTLESISLA